MSAFIWDVEHKSRWKDLFSVKLLQRIFCVKKDKEKHMLKRNLNEKLKMILRFYFFSFSPQKYLMFLLQLDVYEKDN